MIVDPPSDRCGFSLHDEANHIVTNCDRTDVEEVVMYDGGKVYLCPKHRSWGPALRRENDT